MEQLNFNMLFRWFVGLGLDDGVWDASAFCHNRDRLLEAEVSAQLLAGVIQHHKVRGLLSRDHFSVDGTLIEAWASMSFRPKGEDDGDGGSGRNAERDFHGEKRSNATHASTTDPDARLYRKGNGRESKLCYMVHVGRRRLRPMSHAVGRRSSVTSFDRSTPERLEKQLRRSKRQAYAIISMVE